MMINHHITKEQLDTLRTNPSIYLKCPAQPCTNCQTLLQVRLVKLGSRADMSYDSVDYAWEKLLQATAGEALRGFLKIPLSLKVRVRIEDAHFSDLYAGKAVMLAGRCPKCRHELVTMLKKF